ncbi:CHASE2 domain-containing protein [Nostoc sp. 2RC]|uniref:CHASE2 domain-containing protein n=1 Tax=Nostoc sp. 2RC TaxID=2485484 RepID=UPI00162AD47E|nr:CHASE2 domain-containing protein [Nostoc sp. 2RC]MBC1237257.1 CHASE2 domain-containing protein [Nostoc sp. 2RC]
MGKLIVINLDKGNLNDGFSVVNAQLWDDNNSRPMQFTGSLPAAPQIAELYKRYQLIYQALQQRFHGRALIEMEPVGLTNISETDFTEICQELHQQINSWLNSNSFRKIDQQLRARLTLDEEFQVIIETSDRLLRKLPWHLWNFFDDYQKSEVALTPPSYERVKVLSKKNHRQVRILAILGNSTGIDIQKDQTLLKQLPHASTVFLVEPSRQELDKWLWDKQGWDILFFAGHSESQEDTGLIHINQTSSLTIPELKNALKYAVAQGLKLAIFNSCDGLGLAWQLADLHIPQVIIMRENVPDFVAQEFLKNFLSALAGGQSYYLAARYARERLQGLEDEFPTASWLPLIYQNPATEPLTWNGLRGQTPAISSPWFKKNRLQTALVASIAIALATTTLRSLGIMQQWELSAFDSMMQIRPDEGPDQRLLIVKITEADIQAQKQRQKSSLSDEVLQQLMQKLELYQPRAIGLDLYRDFAVEPQYKDLATRLHKSDNFFAICKLSGGNTQATGISPPPEIPGGRVGFSDVVLDSDFVVRRQLLAVTPDPQSPCKTRYSLSWQLASYYLAKEGIQFQINNQGHLQLGKIVFKPIDIPTGGYQQFDAGGHQLLLNYRASQEVAPQVTLAQVLKGQLNPEWVKNRIVLIGVDADSVKDSFLTPYSTKTRPYQQIPGIVIHAHMVSQILSAVMNRRPLLWVWPAWGEVLWLCSWSLVGGIIAVYPWWRWQLVAIIAVALITLYGCCFILLLFGGWVPFVPTVFALITTTFGIRLSTRVYQNNI